MKREKSKFRGQSSFEAIIGVVVCVFLFGVALSYLSIDSELVAESYHRRQVADLAVVLSNDLLLNPGYEGHFGLALYDGDTRSVEEHFLDASKFAEIDEAELREQWGIGQEVCVRIEEVGGVVLRGCSGGHEKNVYTVRRLGLVKEREEVKVVRLTLELYE